MRLRALSLLLLVFVFQCFSYVRITSPDANIAIAFRLDSRGTPEWQVLRKGAVLLAWSPLGLTFREGSALTSGFTMLDSEIREHDETYQLVIGKTKEARDYYRELRVRLQESLAPRRRLDLLFRVGAEIVEQGIHVFHPGKRSQFCQSEIDDLHRSIHGDDDVGRLDVPVDYPPLMSHCQPRSDLHGQGYCIFSFDRAALHLLLKGLTFIAGHHNKDLPFLRPRGVQ